MPAAAPLSLPGFTGVTLPGSGLDDMHARDYNPSTGAFTSVDPLAATTGEIYAYAGDIPVSQTDPSGAITCPSWLPGCEVITGIQNRISADISTWWREWWTDNPCNNPAAASAPLTLLHPLSSLDQALWNTGAGRAPRQYPVAPTSRSLQKRTGQS